MSEETARRIDEPLLAAIVTAKDALTKAEGGGDPRAAALLRGNLSVLHHRLGELDAAAELSNQALAELGDLGLERFEGCFEAYGALLAAERGELDHARALADSAAETLHAFGDQDGLLLAELCTVGVRLAETKRSGTTEQREVAHERAEFFAESPAPNLRIDPSGPAKSNQGPLLLRRLLGRA